MYQQYVNQIQSNITYLSSDELKDLLNNDDELEKRIDEVLKTLEDDKESMLNENRTIAEENISKEPRIIDLRAAINELATEGKEICASLEEKLADFKSKSGNLNQETALALLQTAAAETEEESEQIYKQFLDGELDGVESFIAKFTESRKKMHERKLKADKMAELIRHPARASAGPGYPMGGSGGSFYPSPGGLPYPTGPGGMMPMPNMFGRPY